MNSLTITPVFGGKCDLEYLMGSAHKQPWRPPATNIGPLCLIESCDLWSQETLAASGREIHMPGLTAGLRWSGKGSFTQLSKMVSNFELLLIYLVWGFIWLDT